MFFSRDFFLLCSINVSVLLAIESNVYSVLFLGVLVSKFNPLFTWYAKLAPTRRKCFTACECISSQPANPQLTYELRHKNGNMIRKWASNMRICMPERRSVNTKSQFLTPIIVTLRHPIHPIFQFSLFCQLRKRGTHQEPHKSILQKFFLKRNIYVT